MISVVMATFNGGLYLREQLDSILNCNRFDELVDEVIISDDNSSDNTIKIVKDYISKNRKIKLIKNEGKGVKSNFLNAIKNASSKYIILSDQDDVWDKHKIEILFKEVQNTENKFELPSLVFSDSEIVDSSLNLLNESFFKFNNLDITSRLNLKSIILKNVCQGCVVIFNRELSSYLYSMDTNRWVMHDWVLMIIAMQKGRVTFVNDKLIKYRIHGGNAIGENKTSLFNKIKNISSELKAYDKYIDSVFKQAIYLKEIDVIDKVLVFSFKDWLEAENSNLRKIASMFKYLKIRRYIGILNEG